jgi:hypothetical protein
MANLQDCIDVLTEIIQSQHSKGVQHQPTPADYFQVITNAISTGNLGDKLAVMLRVYEAIIPEVPPVVVASHFQVAIKMLMTIAQANTDDPEVLSVVLTVIGHILTSQETSEGFWSGLTALQALNGLLAFIDDDHPMVRKASHKAVIELLHSHKQRNALSVRSYIMEFGLGVFKACTRSNYRRAHCLVVLLESCLVDLPELERGRSSSSSHSLLSFIETMIKLQYCEIPKLTASVYRTLDAFYQNTNFYHFSHEFSFQSLALLVEKPPVTTDIESICSYLNAMTSAMMLCIKETTAAGQESGGDKEKRMSSLLHLMEKMILGVFENNYLSSEYQQIHCAIGNNLKRIQNQWFQEKQPIKEILLWFQENHSKGDFNSQSSNNRPQSVRGMSIFLSFYEHLLSIKYHPSWIFLLESLRSYLDSFYYHFSSPSVAQAGQSSQQEIVAFFFKPVIHKLNDLYSSVVEKHLFPLEIPFLMALQETLVKVFHTIGLISFLQIIPMFEIKESPTFSFHTKEWVMELFLKELKNMKCKITDFVFSLLPIAGKIHKLVQFYQKKLAAASSSSEENDSNRMQAKLLSNKVIQLWYLLPEICSNQILDIDSSFTKVIPICQQTIQETDYPDLPFTVVLTLKNIINGVTVHHYYQNEKQKKLLIEQLFPAQAPNIIMMFLQYLETFSSFSDGKVKETISCLGKWMKFVNESFMMNIVKRLLQVILTTTIKPTASTDAMDEEENNNSNYEKEKEQKQNQEKAAIWMSVLLTMVPLMSPSLVSILYKTIRPLLSLEETILLQKRAYQLLHSLITHHSVILFQQFANNDASAGVLSLLQFLQESLLTAQVSARNIRLKCIECLVEKICSSSSGNDEAALKSCFALITSELLVCLKDANKKTRETALQILKLFSSSLPMVYFYRHLGSYLEKTESPSMRSAVITALAIHLSQRFSAHMEMIHDELIDQEEDSGDEEEESEAGEEEDDEEFQNNESKKVSPAAAPSTVADPSESYEELVQVAGQSLSFLFPLFPEESNEQTKALLLFAKVVILMSDKETILNLFPLSGLINAITRQINKTVKSKFSSQIRSIFRKLMKKFDESELRVLIPGSDIPLLDYIMRENRKSLKKRLQKKQFRQEQHALRQMQGMYGRAIDNDADDVEMEEEEAPKIEGTKSTVKGGNSQYTKTDGKKTTVGTRTVATKSVATKTVANRTVRGDPIDYDEDDDEDFGRGVSKDDYRFSADRRVKAIRAKDYQLEEPTTLAELIDPKKRKTITFDKDVDKKNSNSKKRKQEEPEEDKDNDSDMGLSDVEEEQDNEDYGNEEDDFRGGKHNKKKNMLMSNKNSQNIDNPFPTHSRAQKMSNKKQKTLTGGALPVTSASLENSSGRDVRREDEKYQVILGKDGRLKIQEKPVELFSSGSQSVLDRKTTVAGKSLAGGMNQAGSVYSASSSYQKRQEQNKKKGLRLKTPGIEYRAKGDTGGDVWKKGQKTQPHAFIPLDPKLLSRKHQSSAIEHFGHVVNHHQKNRKKLKVVRKK